MLPALLLFLVKCSAKVSILELKKYLTKSFTYLLLTVDPFLRVQLQHTDFELEVSGDELVQGDHKTMG